MKRSKKMLLMLLALVLCVGGYYGVQLLGGETASVTEEAGSFALESHAAGDLTGLAWTQDGEDFGFTLADGTWSVSADPAFPLNQEDVQSMADDLLAVMGTRQLDGVTDLAAYGLSEPAFTVTAAWSDGTSTTWALGDETPFGDGYYLSLGHESIVYTIEDDISSFFDTTLNDLAVLETIPTTAAATRLTVGSTLDIVKEASSRTINENELWYDHLTGSVLDADAAEDLIADAQAISWSELTEATAADDELAAWGLDEASATAITLYEGDAAAMTLLIGAQNDNGDYYARLPGSTMVYTVESSDLSALLSASADSMPSMILLDVSADNVLSAVFSAGESSYTWQPAAAAQTEDTEATDAAEVTADATGETLWESILALSVQERLTEADPGDVLLTVEVESTAGQSAVLTFSEHDADSYVVSTLDRIFLVDAADVDAIIRTLRANTK